MSHEIWEDCPYCKEEYDLRRNYRTCPSCHKAYPAKPTVMEKIIHGIPPNPYYGVMVPMDHKGIKEQGKQDTFFLDPITNETRMGTIVDSQIVNIEDKDTLQLFAYFTYGCSADMLTQQIKKRYPQILTDGQLRLLIVKND